MMHPTTPTDLAVLLVSATLVSLNAENGQGDDLDRSRTAALEEFVTSDAGTPPELQGVPDEPFMRWFREFVEHERDVKIRMAQVIGTLEALATAALVDLEAATGAPALTWVEEWRAAQS